LEEVGELIKVEIICLDYNSEFYTLKPEGLNICCKNILHTIKLEHTLITHNSWGEYGNLDHIIINRLAKNENKNLIVTNIARSISKYGVPLYNCREIGEYLGKFTVNLDLYSQCKEIYKRYNCWTWDDTFFSQIKLYYQQHNE